MGADIADPRQSLLSIQQILIQLIGSKGLNVLGSFEELNEATGLPMATVPAVRIYQDREHDLKRGVIRRMVENSGIEIVISSNPTVEVRPQAFGTDTNFIHQLTLIQHQRGSVYELSRARIAIARSIFFAERNSTAIREEGIEVGGTGTQGFRPARVGMSVLYLRQQNFI